MLTFNNPFEQKLAAQTKEAEQLRKSFSEKLAAQKSLTDVYTPALARLRELNVSDARKGEVSPKEFIRLAGSAPLEARQAIAFKAPSDGVAKAIMKYMLHLKLGREDNLYSALLCIIEDCEQSFAFLPEARLPEEDQMSVVLAALKNYPTLNYEDFKTQEVMYQTANTEDARGMQEIQRRFEQARGKKMQHVRKHVLNYIPEEIRALPGHRKILLQASLQKDTFGTLEALREAASSEALKSTSKNLLDGITAGERLELLEMAAELGMGLASNYLDLFAIPNEPECIPRLQKILQRDLTAGHSLFGVYALEGVQNYPFELERIEPVLPRRITNSEGLEYLKRADADAGKKARTYSGSEVADVVKTLQEKDIRRFMESLKWGIGSGWKTWVQDRKREVIFGDYDLKVRNIIFLVAYSLFEEEEKFENIFNLIQKNHPLLNDDLPKTYLLANRYYFLDMLGLNAGFLFNRSRRASGSFGTLIEEVTDYQARTFMHLGMSIFLRVGDALFRDMPIAWTMLIGQCDGKIDTVFHELVLLFDVFDTLLTIVDPVIPNLSAWVPALLHALSQDAPELPSESAKAPEQTQLRITTRTTIARTRENISRYCLDALYLRVKKTNASPIAIVQTLKMPRSKTDKLMTLLQNDPNKDSRAQTV
jgi:hypothetical protein